MTETRTYKELRAEIDKITKERDRLSLSVQMQDKIISMWINLCSLWKDVAQAEKDELERLSVERDFYRNFYITHQNDK